ncbi:MAG: hypothetical protein ACTSW1_07580 [Candidatus Hodarchaeales archaeon]
MPTTLPNLWTLKMHETLEIDTAEVTRVPGGWIYRWITSHYNDGIRLGGSQSAVFVPYFPPDR